MQPARNSFVLVIAMFLSACLGPRVSFVKPADDQLVLTSTTKDQIIALMGRPNFRAEKLSNGETVEIVTYYGAKVGDESVFVGLAPVRVVSLYFHKNVLVGKEFASSCKSDSTYFDFGKARSIKQGMTEQDVVALLGTAGGEYRYPVISNREGRALVYIFVQMKGGKSQENVLVVELDGNASVQKVDFNQVGQL